MKVKDILFGLLFAVGFISVLVVFSILQRGCNTANEMADQTVFNASKHVNSYEDFYGKYEQYLQYKQQYEDAMSIIHKLEAEGKANTQRYDNLLIESDGTRNMMKRIAADYNKMSNISYKKIWKDKDLPEKLGH